MAADGRLSDWDTLFSYIDAEGYTSAAIRAVFEHHAGKIRDAQLGSDKHLVWLDLWTALPRCSERTNLVLKLLSEGFGPKDIGRQIDGNGSRLVSAACAELSAALGEIFGGTTFALND